MNDQPVPPLAFEDEQNCALGALKANPVVAEVDGFVRSKPYFTALGAFALGVLVAHSINHCRSCESSRSLGDTLDELKGVIGNIADQIEDSAGHASGMFSSAIGNALKKSKRFF